MIVVGDIPLRNKVENFLVNVIFVCECRVYFPKQILKHKGKYFLIIL